MAAPVTRPAGSNEISTNLPKREELSLREVLALPKASSKGLDSSTCSRQSCYSADCSREMLQHLQQPALWHVLCRTLVHGGGSPPTAAVSSAQLAA